MIRPRMIHLASVGAMATRCGMPLEHPKRTADDTLPLTSGPLHLPLNTTAIGGWRFVRGEPKGTFDLVSTNHRRCTCEDCPSSKGSAWTPVRYGA